VVFVIIIIVIIMWRQLEIPKKILRYLNLRKFLSQYSQKMF